MRLYTFQSLEAIKVLKTQKVLSPPWAFYSPRDPFQPAYRWMATQMLQRNFPLTDKAPVWAWHSCEEYGQGPTLDVASNLLSLWQLEQGIKTIEFECPDNLVLLSQYGPWNDIIYYFSDHKEAKEPPEKLVNQLFQTDKAEFKAGDHLQACLPYLSLDWVLDIRELALKGDDAEFDRNQLC